MNIKQLFTISYIVVLLFSICGFGSSARAGNRSWGSDRIDFTPNLFILSIGIENYQNITDLRYSIDDAEVLTSEFERRSKNKFNRIESVVLRDVTRTEIEKALDDMALKIQPEDTFIFIYSGHGNVNVTRPSSQSSDKTEQVRDEYYLYPQDSDWKNNPEKLISGKTMRSYFRRIQAENQLIILDTCNSAQAFESLAASFIEQDPYYISSLRQNILFIGTDTLSWELTALKHGVLTSIILDALSGKAEIKKDGFISARELEAYLYSRTLESSEKKVITEDFHPRTVTRGKDFFIANTNKTVKALKKRTETRGEIEDEPDPLAKRDGTDYALFFATDDYANGWDKLPNPVKDAEAIKTQLIERYGYDEQNIRIEEDKTRFEIEKVLDEYIAKGTHNEFKPDDQLFIHFGGHGEINKEGEPFLATADAPKELSTETENKYLHVQRLLQKINRIKCNHIFVVFDACRIGRVWNVKFAPPPMEPSLTSLNFDRNIDLLNLQNLPVFQKIAFYPTASQSLNNCSVSAKKVIKERTRLALTAGSGPVSDGGEFSPLTENLLELMSKDSDCGVTSREIFTAVDNTWTSGEENSFLSEPMSGTFAESNGGFVFVVKE